MIHRDRVDLIEDVRSHDWSEINRQIPFLQKVEVQVKKSGNDYVIVTALKKNASTSFLSYILAAFGSATFG